MKLLDKEQLGKYTSDNLVSWLKEVTTTGLKKGVVSSGFIEGLVFGKWSQHSWGKHGEQRGEQRQGRESQEAGEVFWKQEAIQFPGMHKEQTLEKEGGEECGAHLREAGTVALKAIHSQCHTAWAQIPILPLARFVTLGITSL